MLNSEKIFIGNLILNGKIVLERLPPSFSFDKLQSVINANIFKYLINNIMDGNDVDITEISKKLNIPNNYMLECIKLYNSAIDNIYDPLKLVDAFIEENRKEHLVFILRKYSHAVETSSNLEEIRQKLLLDLEAFSEEKEINLITTDNLIEKCIKSAKEDKFMQRIYTGLDSLDRKFPMFKGGYYIIGARTSQAKSHLALFTGINSSLRDSKVIFFSLEMTEEMQFSRIAGYFTKLDSKVFQRREGVLKNVELIKKSCAGLNNLEWDFNYRNVYEIGQITRIKKPDMIIVDFIGEVERPFKKQRDEEIGEISSQLKAIGKKHSCVVLALSQLNRKAEEGKITLANLSLSSTLEHNADGVIMLRLENRETMSVEIQKNRLGETCKLNYKCDLSTSRFWEDI